MVKFWSRDALPVAGKTLFLGVLIAGGVSCCLLCCCQNLSAQQAPAGKQPKSSSEKPKTEKVDGEKQEAEPGEDTDKLPLLETLALPGIDQLLTGEKEDWIVLIGGRVLKVPAIYPRPDHLKWLEEEKKKLLARRPSPADQRKNADLLQEWQEKYRALNAISVTYADKESEDDYLLPVRYIDHILYHEDLALRKAEELISQGNSVDAQRLISAVGRWSFQNNVRRKKEHLPPIQWPGLLEAQRKLLLLNFKQAGKAADWERAFALVKIHHSFDARFDQEARLLEESVSAIASQAMEKGDYRKIRFYVRELQKMLPAHPQIESWQTRLKELSREKGELARKEFQKKNYREASLLARQAVQIWPFDSQNRRLLSRIQERYQILRVGHLEQDGQREFQRRCLLDHHWFHVEKITEGYPRFRSRFIETWTPGDLGRSVRLKMKMTRQPYESRPELESFQLARDLEAVSVGSEPQQRGLYANSIRSIHANSPDQLEIHLATQSPHPFGLLAALLNAEFNTELSNPALSGRQTVLANSFYRPRENSMTEFVRSFPEPDNLTNYNVAEVQVRSFADKKSLLRAMLRDELDYIPSLPLAHAKRLGRDQRFFVLKYHTPRVTLLQFHLHGALASEPALRLALLASLDRDRMKEAVARTEGFAPNKLRLTKSIAPSNSHAKNRSGQIVEFDRIAARALYLILTRSAKKKEKKISTVRLSVSEEPGMMRLADFIKMQWESMGLKVVYVNRNDSKRKETKDTAASPASWDAAIVSHQMLAPQYELPRLLSENGRLTEPELQRLPLPMQRSLLELEEARNWSEVDKSLRQLQDLLVLDAWVLPLWEQDAYQAIRREVRNAPAKPVTPYQNLDRWVIDPVIPAY